jgi:hypothetical protein
MLSIVLSLVLTGVQFTITAPAGCHPCYVEADTGQIFQFDLAPGESFGSTINPAPLSSSVRVRVWTETSGADADAEQVLPLPAPYRVYIP